MSSSPDIKFENESCIVIEKKDFDKCPVCLQAFNSLKSKSYTSKCFHSFCFECILEWSKIRYNCPLCKTEFDRIVYDLCSRLEFKEYNLKLKETFHPTQDIIHISPNASSNPQSPVAVSKASWLLNVEQAPLEFRIMVYVLNLHANPNQIQSNIKISNIELEFQENSTDKPKENVSSDNLDCISYKPVFRFRSVKPDWFKNNPACTHRLMQFIYRELKALACIVPSSSADRLRQAMRSQLISVIINLVKKIEIDSDEFYEEIKEHIKPSKYARHFQHELNAFAISPSSDLVEYDSKCVYYKDLKNMPSNNELLAINPKIIPFNSLPVNLCRYRLSNRQSDLKKYTDDFESYLNVSQVQPSTSGLSFRRDSDLTLELSRSDSEYSSFCEVVSPPRKNTPPYVVLTSSSESEHDVLTSGSRSVNVSSNTQDSNQDHSISASQVSVTGGDENAQVKISDKTELSTKRKSRERSSSRHRHRHHRKHKKHKKKHSRDRERSSSRKKSKRKKHKHESSRTRSRSKRKSGDKKDEKQRHRSKERRTRSRSPIQRQ